MYDIRTDGRKIWRKNTHVAISTEDTRPRNGYIFQEIFSSPSPFELYHHYYIVVRTASHHKQFFLLSLGNI